MCAFSLILAVVQVLTTPSGAVLVELPWGYVGTGSLLAALTTVVRLVAAAIPLFLVFYVTKMNDITNAVVKVLHLSLIHISSRLFVQKRTRFVQGTAVLALDVPCPLPVPSLVGYERLLRFFRVICMAIAQVSVTPPARSAMPSAICGRGASPVAASAAAFAGACLESVVLGKGLGASGFDSGFGAGVSGSGAGAGVSGVGGTGGVGAAAPCAARSNGPVSYTHLDVYKRQVHDCSPCELMS